MEKNVAQEGERRRRSSTLRALDSTLRHAYEIGDVIAGGWSFSRREMWDKMSDYEWRRARGMLIHVGILDKYGEPVICDPIEIGELLVAEYKAQSTAITNGRTPPYLVRKDYNKKRRSIS